MATRRQKAQTHPTVVAAAEAGDRLGVLTALQLLLARQIETAPESVQVQLSAELRRLGAEISELSPGSKVRTVDELRSRREARLPDPNDVRKATGTTARKRS